MKYYNFFYLGFWLVLIFLTACAPSSEKSEQERLQIAVAANMQFAMKALTAAFGQKTGIQTTLIISSSGKLTAQIKEGAPFDVFVSADMKYPSELEQSGLAAYPPKVYGYGKLVLWTMRSDLEPSLELLTNPDIGHIAIANPQIAPYGEAALEVLNQFDLTKKVLEKLVYGESISQVNQFVITQAAELGFTALAAVLSPEMKGKGKYILIDENIYSPIQQGIVVIRRKEGQQEKAKQFYDFLLSESAKPILESFGYRVTAPTN